ncbi:MAG: bifunctional 5,10-methylenetetrahydrofolate dehydrogenase/5,10-methenyltetrahydrofolate cyclohydrolase [Gemmatimonadota bacterium]|nr:bifunctional 5,10-methylenetetrahydrofolate dehydrogenase/5,10-methenyltetrahydrofolate cyclohydrolase [Gemmatimonadota bacterium]
MSATLIDGEAIARRIRGELAAEGRSLSEATGTVPGLAAVLVGDDPASATYVRMKKRACEEAGFRSRVVRLPEDTPQENLLDRVRELNGNPEVHGILVQLPLPPQIDPPAVVRAIDPGKDVDGFHPENVGKVALGELETAFVPATPAGILRLLRETGVEVAGSDAVVVGRSDIVGKPAALLLLHAHATVTICHSATRALADHTRRAEVLVVAAGRPALVTGEMIRPGAAVIDVGTNRVEDPSRERGWRLEGDVAFEEAREVAGAITPVPGGVGPMTIAMLLSNTLVAARRAAGIAPAPEGALS